MNIAKKTLKAIADSIDADGGASYRGFLGKVIGHISDAYDTSVFPFRSHMGASMIGNKCAREIWYGFRWATIPSFDSRVLRLFNRGHMEEARFIAMLLSAGIAVYQQDTNGKQFRISDAGGHFGGSGDGVLVGIPDVPEGTKVLGEFKTSSDSQFQKMVKNGVKKEKFEHYVQMQIYMRKMGIAVALYMVVNKNNDELHAEIVHLDSSTADEFLNRGTRLVFMKTPPEKLNIAPSWWECRYCDHKPVCHHKEPAARTCRSCRSSLPTEDGTWMCKNKLSEKYGELKTSKVQFEACDNYKGFLV